MIWPCQRPLKSLKYKTPFDILKEFYEKEPALFYSNPCHKIMGLNILIEDTGSGTALIQQLRHEKINCTAIKPIGDKIERLASASIAFEQRRIFFPQNASWLPELERELLGFPKTKHDDQVDSVSQFLNWALTDGRYFVGSGRTIGYY
jgi:predicted phage terminase large subunit-like protein